VSIFTRDDVQRLARLARLELADPELDLFARQLGEILEFARQIEAVDTTSSRPIESAGSPPDVLRADVVEPSLDRDDVLAGAPEADAAAGLFTVPRVLNG
jgi:aspartyl-tRNA(Asn)/glutamyl-tRNA(Gln) amidotransferase subunit C